MTETGHSLNERLNFWRLSFWNIVSLGLITQSAPKNAASPDTERHLNHTAVRMIIFHAILLATGVWIYVSLITEIESFFSGYGSSLSRVIDQAFLVSHFLRKYFFLLLIPGYLGLRWDAAFFKRIYRLKGQRAASLWSGSITLILSLWAAYPGVAALIMMRIRYLW